MISNLNEWIKTEPEFSEHSILIELTQTYQQWLDEHFPNGIAIGETQSMLL